MKEAVHVTSCRISKAAGVTTYLAEGLACVVLEVHFISSIALKEGLNESGNKKITSLTSYSSHCGLGRKV
eukprot:snap_masked-scaffold_5-processed-gene-12.33-mRNA-1 protein AED:1.00 eAED:1.00 QI:0/0/0/0/1/1/2/0/69